MGSEEKFEVRPDPFDVDSVKELTPDRLYSLRGKVALVTGGGGDLGRYLAAGLGAAGAALLLTDVKASELVESVGF